MARVRSGDAGGLAGGLHLLTAAAAGRQQQRADGRRLQRWGAPGAQRGGTARAARPQGLFPGFVTARSHILACIVEGSMVQRARKAVVKRRWHGGPGAAGVGGGRGAAGGAVGNARARRNGVLLHLLRRRAAAGVCQQERPRRGAGARFYVLPI